MNRIILLLLLIGTAYAQEPLYEQTMVDTGTINEGDVWASMSMSNVKQMYDYVKYDGFTIAYTSCGGCSVRIWARGGQTHKDRPLWSGIPNNVTHLHIFPVNPVIGVDKQTYVAQTTFDTEKLLKLIASRRPNLKQAVLSGLHGEPFAKAGSKQPNWAAHASGEIARDIAANPPLGLPFEVIQGPYMYAEQTPRGDGLFWERNDFRSDLVHQTTKGKKKSAALIHEYFDASYTGESSPPDNNPPPDTEPPPPPEEECKTWRGKVYCRPI